MLPMAQPIVPASPECNAAWCLSRIHGGRNGIALAAREIMTRIATNQPTSHEQP